MKFLDRIFSGKSGAPGAFRQTGGWTRKVRAQLDRAKSGDKQGYIELINLVFENPLPVNNPDMNLSEVTRLLSCNPRFTPAAEIKAVEMAGEYQEYHEELSGLVAEMKKALVGFPSSGISGGNVDTIFQLAGYELHISNSSSLHSHCEHNVHHLNISVETSKSRAALDQLRAEKSPLSTNLLHKIQNKHDFTIKTGTCTSYSEEKINFSGERERARAELQQRGNPPYNPENYFMK